MGGGVCKTSTLELNLFKFNLVIILIAKYVQRYMQNIQQETYKDIQILRSYILCSKILKIVYLSLCSVFKFLGVVLLLSFLWGHTDTVNHRNLF